MITEEAKKTAYSYGFECRLGNWETAEDAFRRSVIKMQYGEEIFSVFKAGWDSLTDKYAKWFKRGYHLALNGFSVTSAISYLEIDKEPGFDSDARKAFEDGSRSTYETVRELLKFDGRALTAQ